MYEDLRMCRDVMETSLPLLVVHAAEEEHSISYYGGVPLLWYASSLVPLRIFQQSAPPMKLALCTGRARASSHPW